jgi:amphi-Trp domain-containing protein
MADVKVERTVTTSRHEAARWIADIAKSLDGDGRLAVQLADSTVEMEVPDRVQCQVEVEVDGDDVELEIELTWSPVAKGANRARPNGSAGA